MNLPPMRLLIAFVVALAAASPSSLTAQRDKDKWKIDPYTKNDPKKMADAGYVSFGPFQFGSLAADPVQTTKIDEALEYVDIIWVETAHFRIGTNLPEWSVPTVMKTRKKIRDELTELKERIPSINPRAKRLDPWLRAHLTAHRMEKLYAETQKLFGVTDADFPAKDAQVVRGERYMGYGPFLGMKDKFLVLAFDKAEPYRQYLKAFVGRDSRHPQRWHFVDASSLLIALACESDEFPLKHDTALHCALAFNVSQNLLDGFRYYSYDLPVWLKEGFGHWNARRIDGDWSNFDQNEGALADMKVLDKWEPYCRGLLHSPKKWAPFAEVAGWRDFGDITFNDHVMIFGRMDYLISQGPEKWQKFLFEVKGRVDENWLPDQKDLVGATRTALKEAYGLTFLNFDERWAEWVNATYPAK